MKYLKHIPEEATEAVQSCEYGAVKIKFSADGRLISLSSPPKHVVYADIDGRHVLDCLGIDSDRPHHVKIAHVASCGLPFLYIRVDDDVTVSSARASTSGARYILESLAAKYLAEDPKKLFSAIGVVLYWVDPELSPQNGVVIHQRVFTTDVSEDPATGSACIASVSFLCYSSYLVLSERRQAISSPSHPRTPDPSKHRSDPSYEGTQRRANHQDEVYCFSGSRDGSAIHLARQSRPAERRRHRLSHVIRLFVAHSRVLDWWVCCSRRRGMDSRTRGGTSALSLLKGTSCFWMICDMRWRWTPHNLGRSRTQTDIRLDLRHSQHV